MRKIKNGTVAIAFFILAGCSFFHKQETGVDPTSLSQLQNMSSQAGVRFSKKENNELRLQAIQETALGLGAQGGLAVASRQIDLYLEKDKSHLDNIFNFDAMVLSHGVMPPVLVESNNNLNLADPNTIRVSDKTYKIIKQAHFATTPPNWRDYLWLPYNKPELPDKVLLPKTAEEREVWRRAVYMGWQSGMQQAYNIFHQSLARLKRDFQGMVLYRKLLQEKMINPPFVSRTELGVTGNGSVMRINDQVLRITELPHLQTDSRNWQAIVVQS